MDLVKDCAHFICHPLTHIINLPKTSGIVPDQLKITLVIPIIKSGDKSSFPNNYRPVSVLPMFPKILERGLITNNCLLDYLLVSIKYSWITSLAFTNITQVNMF